jgi:hypothetical protein
MYRVIAEGVFAGLCDRALSAEEVVSERLRLHDWNAGWAWICLTELWQRWWPEKACLELPDDKIQEGYAADQRNDFVASGRIWLGVGGATAWAAPPGRQASRVREAVPGREDRTEPAVPLRKREEVQEVPRCPCVGVSGRVRPARFAGPSQLPSRCWPRMRRRLSTWPAI